MILYNTKLPKLDNLSAELKEKLLNLSIQLSYITIQDLFNKCKSFITTKNGFPNEYNEYSDLSSVELNLTSEEYHTLFNTLCVIEESYEITSEKYFRNKDAGYISPLAFPQCLLFLKIHFLYISLYKTKEENAKINKIKIEPLDINEDELFFVLDAASWYVTCRRITELKEHSEDFLESKEKVMNKMSILNYTLKNAIISEDSLR